MEFRHRELAGGRWQALTFAQQMAHIGSEVSRAARWQDRDERIFWSAVERALELFYLTIADPRWRARLKELLRLREIFCDAVLGGNEYHSTLRGLQGYFLYFALLSRKQGFKMKQEA